MNIRLTHIPDSSDPSDFSTVRDMPAVPRIGEEVAVSELGEFYDGKGQVHDGIVRRVFWGADGTIEIRYR